MVKSKVFRWILTFGGLVIMILILLSKSSNTAKGIGVIMAILLISMGIIATGRFKKYFEETKEGNIRPPESGMGYQ